MQQVIFFEGREAAPSWI